MFNPAILNFLAGIVPQAGDVQQVDPNGVPPISAAPPPPPDTYVPPNAVSGSVPAQQVAAQEALRIPLTEGQVPAPTQEADGGESVVESRLPPEEMPFRGRFGIRGTFRDILGTLGDAFLTQAGRDTVYAPQVQREREIRAMQGFQTNPEEAIAHLNSEFGNNPQLAMQLNQQTLDNRHRDARLDIDRETKLTQQAAREQQRNQRGWQYVTSYFNGINERDYPAVVAQAEEYMRRHNIEPLMRFPATYSQEGVEALRRSGMTPYQAGSLDVATANSASQATAREVSSRVSKQNANTSSTRAREQRRHNRVIENLRQRQQTFRENNPPGRNSGRMTGRGGSSTAAAPTVRPARAGQFTRSGGVNWRSEGSGSSLRWVQM